MSAKDRIFGKLIQLRTINQDVMEVIPGASLRLHDDQLILEDPADNTKAARFELGGLTTGTTRVLTVPDLDMNLGTGVGAKVSVIDTGGVFATPIVLTAADSGKIFLLDDAAGLDFTLPAIAAADVGIRYTFFINVTNTSNSYRITAQTGDLMRGHVLISDFDAAYTAPQILAAEADESNDLVITTAAVAQGGRAGGWLDLTAIHATGWFVRGNLLGDGTIVTVFS